MANLFGKNCDARILNSEQEKKSYSNSNFLSLKRNHVLVGNESAEAIQAELDPSIFDISPRTCNSPRVTLKTLDHGLLGGLGDDDHPQYVHVSINKTISADHIFTGDQSFSGITHFTGGIRDAGNVLGESLQVLSTLGAGVPRWKDVSELAIDHGFLLGLEDDDHEQYVHVSIDRDISADHTFSGDIEISGTAKFSGKIKDSEGNLGTKGQIPIAESDGKFQWKTPVVENVYWVSKDGNDSNDGLSPQTSKASIKAAVRASHSGVLGKIMDASESILSNKSLIVDEVSNQLYTRPFTLPSSTPFDLKTRDAYRQILANRNDIVTQAIATVSSDPQFSNAGSKCTRDSKYLVLALAKDIFYGGYANSYKFTSGYFDVNNDLISSIFSPILEKTLTIQVFNEIKTRLKSLLSPSTYLYIRSRIDELCGYVTDSLSNNNLNRFPSQSDQEFLKSEIYYNLDSLVTNTWNTMISIYPSVLSTESTCKRDIKLIAIAAAEDIGLWGNVNLMNATKSYFDNVGIFSNATERQASAYAYEVLRNSIRALTTKVPIIAKVNVIFDPLITALTANSSSGLIDYDEGDINKSAKLCNRDLNYFIDAVASDMKNGGNVFSVEFGEGYYDANNLQFINSQLPDTIWAFDKARTLMILSMKNWRTNMSGTLYVPEYSLERVFVDNSIVYEDWPACANAETAINNYYQIIEFILNNGPNAVAKDARRLIYESIGKGDDPNSLINFVWRSTAVAYPNIEFTEGKCKRDLILVAEGISEDLYSGGNSNTLDVIRSYFPSVGGNPIETQIVESVYAYQQLRDVINNSIIDGVEFGALRTKVTQLIGYLTTALTAGNLNSLPTEDAGTWTLQKPSYKTSIFVNPGVYNEDNPIHLPPNTVVTGNSLRGITVNAMNRTLDLFHVNNACGLSFMTFSNHLAPSYAVSFPKKNNQGIAGIISRSPYVQQCTSITTTGGGMLVDGAITEGFKSMVLDSYTQYNQGGPGVKIINNGYAQLVSLFTISCSAGIECASGGQCDLTNSNSSLGDYGLVADGVGSVEIVAKLLDDVPAGETRVRLKLPGVLKPYSGQVGYFGTKYYALKEIKILNGGSGYQSAPIITIEASTGPQAIPARARAIIDNGTISEVIVIKGGTAYTEVPLVSIAAPTGTGGVPATYEVIIEPIYYQIVSSTGIDNDGTTIATLITPTLYPVSKGTSFVLSRQSKVLASGHSFEYIGAGPNIRTALPIKNGTFIQEQEIEEKNGGSVIFTSTDQSGNFRIGDGVIIDQTTGTIGGVSFSRGLFAQITPLILALQ